MKEVNNDSDYLSDDEEPSEISILANRLRQVRNQREELRIRLQEESIKVRQLSRIPDDDGGKASDIPALLRRLSRVRRQRDDLRERHHKETLKVKEIINEIEERKAQPDSGLVKGPTC